MERLIYAMVLTLMAALMVAHFNSAIPASPSSPSVNQLHIQQPQQRIDRVMTSI